ncbi:MAG: putative glycoside hydrolase/deacetylase ChbG (UPF0249 family) [Spirosomataceae bacterium]|jgi:predicted glycoside hydrolase/deacetylase ChbG (UPF0249 family)
MARKLIINADDYGYVEHIDQAVVEAAQKGVITSVSCFANVPFDELKTKVEKLKSAAAFIKIGLHLTITSGKPLTVCPTLSSGNEFKANRAYRFSESLSELKAELEAQINNFERVMGKGKINHVDCHHNLLYLDFGFFETMLELAKKYSLPMRTPVRIDLLPQFKGVRQLNPVLFMPSVLEALKVRPRKNFFRLLYVVKSDTVNFLAGKIKSAGLTRSDYFTLNIYGNANLNVFRAAYPVIAENEVCEQIMHLSKPTTRKDRKNAPNGINHRYFKGRNEEFELLMSDDFTNLLAFEKNQEVGFQLA